MTTPQTEATGAAAGILIALAAAGQQVIAQITGTEGAPIPATHWSELLFGAGGGLIGGVLLMTTQPASDLIDRVIAVLLSAGIGLALAPAIAHFAAARLDIIAAGDYFAALPIGAVVGATVPPVFGVLLALLGAAKSNPTGIIDFAAKARDRLVSRETKGD